MLPLNLNSLEKNYCVSKFYTLVALLAFSYLDLAFLQYEKKIHDEVKHIHLSVFSVTYLFFIPEFKNEDDCDHILLDYSFHAASRSWQAFWKSNFVLGLVVTCVLFFDRTGVKV